MTEKVVLKIKLTIDEYPWDRNISICIWSTFSHIAETKQVVHEPNRAIWENVAKGNCVLHLWLMTEPLEVQLEFLVMLLFFNLWSHPKIICRKLQDYGSILGRAYFLISFSPATLQKLSLMTTFLWSYFLQSLKKSKKPVSEQVKQRFYS